MATISTARLLRLRAGMPQDTPSRHLDQYVVRFPDGLRDKLKDEAKRNNRSLNAEIIARLERSLGETRDFQALLEQGESIRALLEGIERRIPDLTGVENASTS